MCALFHSYFEDYRHYLRFEKRYSAHTLAAYLSDLEQFRYYLYPDPNNNLTEENRLPLREVGLTQVRNWLHSLREQGQEARSINRKRSSLNGYFLFLMRLGHCDKNPVALMHGMRLPQRIPQFLRPSETEQLFESVTFPEGFEGQTERLILELLYSCGLRRSELSGLRETDIEWSLQQLRVWGKGGKERLIPLGVALLDQLRDYLSVKEQQSDCNRDALFVTQSGKAINDSQVYRLAKKYLAQVSSLKQKSPHILRHTFATHLLNNGANIQAIKELLGHSSIAATQIYTHLNIDKLKKVHKLSHPKG
ncbi:tyrosine-type recombinase/integrase [Rurimicrobium arvi]|uniref:Tyrosine recombinase XerC n=1 Tax=Rurimicrobium arvi TaxID=2049916 RepID=A0ABP8MNB0_9BACT